MRIPTAPYPGKGEIDAEGGDEEIDPRLAAALSLDNPVYPHDPPIEDVRIPAEEPHDAAMRYSFDVLRYQFPNAQVGLEP